MPKPQSWQGPKGMRPRRSRIPDPAQRAARPTEGALTTGIVWLVIGFVGIALCVAGMFVWPLLIVGLVFSLTAFPMALASFRKA